MSSLLCDGFFSAFSPLDGLALLRPRLVSSLSTNTQFQLGRKSDPCAAKKPQNTIEDSGADRAGLTPWEPFVSAAFGYSLLHRGNATAGVRTGRFLATYLEPVGGLEWRPARS